MPGGTKALLLTLLALFGVVAAGCGAGGETAAERGCGEAVLDDWADGRVDGVYASNCYLTAIDLLPEDVRAYSSAVDEISRALQSRRTGESPADPGRVLAVSSSAVAADGGLREVPPALLLLGAVAAIVVVGGGAGFALRRAGGRR